MNLGVKSRVFYLCVIMKVGSNLHATKKFEHTCMPKSNLVLPSVPFRP